MPKQSAEGRKAIGSAKAKWWADVKAGLLPYTPSGKRVPSEAEWLGNNYRLLRSPRRVFDPRRAPPTTLPKLVAIDLAEHYEKRIAAVLLSDDPNWVEGEREILIEFLVSEVKVMRERGRHP